MTLLFAALSAIGVALGRRVAGGVLNEWAGLAGGVSARVMGDTPARLIWAATVAAAALLGGSGATLGAAVGLMTFIGSTTGNFNSMAMGRGPTSARHDWLGMTAHGVISGLLVAAPVVGWMLLGHSVSGHWWLMGLGFATASLCYDLAWRLTGLRGVSNRWPTGADSGPDMAEWLWGAVIGATTYLAFA